MKKEDMPVMWIISIVAAVAVIALLAAAPRPMALSATGGAGGTVKYAVPNGITYQAVLNMLNSCRVEDNLYASKQVTCNEICSTLGAPPQYTCITGVEISHDWYYNSNTTKITDCDYTFYHEPFECVCCSPP